MTSVLNKEKLILDKAIHLFAKKGFHQTSIQEIADECGISKGSIYSYFHSKDALLIESLNYFFSQIEMKFQKIDKLNISSKEKLVKQLAVIFEKVYEYKQIMLTEAYMQKMPLNEKIKKALLRQQMKLRKNYFNRLVNVYGKKIVSHAWDLVVILEGMFYSFSGMFFVKEKKLQSEKLSRYLVSRMDDLVKGILEKKESVIFTNKEMNDYSLLTDFSKKERKERIDGLLTKIKNIFMEQECDKNCIMSVEVLEEELERAEPREVVIDGMLQNIEKEEVAHYVFELKELLQ